METIFDKLCVPYDLSVKLLEHGFNEPCLTIYDYSEKASLYKKTNKDTSTITNDKFASEKIRYRLTAPFWDQARRYCEKLGYHINIFPNYDSNTPIYMAQIMTYFNNDFNIIRLEEPSTVKDLSLMKIFDTYESALEETITYILNDKRN